MGSICVVRGKVLTVAPASVTDTFDRPDATTLGTTSDGKKTWAYAANSAYRIGTNRAIVETAGGLFTYAAPATFDWGSPNGTTKIHRFQGGGGVVTRYVDDSNFWLIDSSGFGVVVAGTYTGHLTTLVTTAATYSITWSGDTWTVKSGDGTSVGTGTSATHNTATRVGFWGGPTHQYDDFSVTA